MSEVEEGAGLRPEAAPRSEWYTIGGVREGTSDIAVSFEVIPNVMHDQAWVARDVLDEDAALIVRAVNDYGRLRAIEAAARKLVTDWSDPKYDGATAVDVDEFNVHRLATLLRAEGSDPQVGHQTIEAQEDR